MATIEINFDSERSSRELFGPNEEYLRMVEKKFGVEIVTRGNMMKISGNEEQVAKAERFFKGFFGGGQEKFPADQFEFEAILDESSEVGGEARREEVSLKIEVPSKKRYVMPRTPGQRGYVESIRKYGIVFAIGPAGTGKTYLAMALAVSYLMAGEVSRIILVRPAVEAGESLGFLPGTMQEKVTPYLRPLYDALYDMMDVTRIQKSIETGVIEVAPLAYMRGRTLNDAFIILDEAQNTTSEQMKMFLTRMGFNSKVVVTGDITQVDLPQSKKSGLMEVRLILKDIDGIKFCYFTEKDVVRHELVQKIVRAYEENQ